jgi:energy-coupling factor transport system substrate-specific component
MGAGLLPRRVRGRAEIAMLIGYSIVAAYGFGLLMNLWFWPFSTGIQLNGSDAGISYVPGAPLLDNLQRFGVYTALTSTFSWDTGRAVTNTVALLVLGPAVLATLRRASRRASYGAPVGFGPDPELAGSRQR